MQPTDFQLEVTEKLSTLIANVAALTEQVKRQNGNVARIWEHLGVSDDRLAVLEKESAARSAVSAAVGKERQKWHERVNPFVLAFALVVGYIILEHAPIVLKALGR